MIANKTRKLYFHELKALCSKDYQNEISNSKQSTTFSNCENKLDQTCTLH